MSQQHGTERSHGLSVGMALRVVNALEPRLHDVVAVPEMNDIIRKAAALARAEQFPGLSVGERALLDVVELRDLRGVDRSDEMNPLGLVERRRPGLRRTPPDIAEFQGAGVHAFDELVREHLERRIRRAEGAQSFVGQANVEAGVGPVVPPVAAGVICGTPLPPPDIGVGEPAPGCSRDRRLQG